MAEEDDAKIAREYRLRELAKEAAREERINLWRELGVDITTTEGINKFREVLDWARKSKERAETFGKRLFAFLGTFAAIATLIGGFIKWILDTYKSGGGH